MSDPTQEKWALLIVDMQRYFLEATAPYSRYNSRHDPTSMDYILRRCSSTVTPNIARLLAATRKLGRPVIYLRLCGEKEDRSDLHYAFRESHQEAKLAGFDNLYPLQSDPLSEIAQQIAPHEGDTVVCKTTFSGFTSSKLPDVLAKLHIQRLVVTGLATSQCVETTARDAADHGIRIVQVEDAQADYCENTHHASLFSSMGVCGGHIIDTDSALEASWFR